MRITCPACDTAYDVPDTVPTAGRALRCARCRTEWVPMPAPEAPTPAPEPPPESREVAAMLRASEPPMTRVAPPARRARAGVVAGWLVSFVALGALGYAAVFWRQPIERAWPPSARAYALLGYR